MIVSGWYDGHSTYGLRILEADVSLYFRPEWEQVTVYLPDVTDPVVVQLTESFWEGSPELRSPAVKTFFARHGLAPWQKKQPPKLELVPLGEGVFRLEWITPPRGQPTLPLD
ncbi:MAG: hypothetical protein LJE93_16995 [Acidobacteria bacterium]|jgi:hypothetical protein|nr:hypothetical protein [Acidobacteriota bacterium]